MKKLALTLLASIALTQSVDAAIAPFAESIREVEAITQAVGTNPDFSEVIPQTEFITKIVRLTRRVNNTGKVYYKIVTRNTHDKVANDLSEPDPVVLPEPLDLPSDDPQVEPLPPVEVVEQQEASTGYFKHRHPRHEHVYLVKLRMTQNEEIGANSVEVLKIKKLKYHN